MDVERRGDQAGLLGDGRDRVSFANATAAVNVSLAAGTATPTSPGDSRPELRPATPPAALLIEADCDCMQLRARPIDPLKLTDLPGYEPISLGHHYQAAVDPRGRLIAAILWPGGSSNSGAKLHLITIAPPTIASFSLIAMPKQP